MRLRENDAVASVSRSLVSALLLVSAAAASAQEHPQELLNEAWIKAEWSKAMRGERFQRWDSWIGGLGGVGSAPVSRRDAAGHDWTIAELCQPHNCGDNKLFVIVDRAGKRVWGMQVTKNPAGRRYFGKPGDATREILLAAQTGNLSRVSLPPGPARKDVAPVTVGEGDSALAGAPGTIEGELSYPSDYIPPDMEICAENTQSKQLICNARKTRRDKPARYSMSVRPGTYHVFARTADAPGRRAYYTEFVTCGNDARCKSHARIAVTVSSGGKVSNVDPQDWYDNP